MKMVFLMMLIRHILAFNDDLNLDDSLNLINRRSLEQKSLCVGSVTVSVQLRRSIFAHIFTHSDIMSIILIVLKLSTFIVYDYLHRCEDRSAMFFR